MTLPDERGRSDGLSTAVIDAVAEYLDVDPLDLDQPLFDVIDPDALDALFGERSHDVFPGALGPKDAEPTVTFDYEGCEVTIEKARIHVEPISD